MRLDKDAARKLAAWMKTVVPGVTTTHVAGTDPFVNVD